MNKCFVYETLGKVSDLKTGRRDGLMTLSGTFGVCGVRNNNHRVYEKKNYESCVKILQERIKENGGIPGELEHPDTMNITLENISHKIIDINIDEKGVVSGTIQLLNTPKGELAQKIVEGGLPLFVSSRAQGRIDKNGNVTLENLSTYDLVGTPGFSQARMHLNENQSAEEFDNFCIIMESSEDATAEPAIENPAPVEPTVPTEGPDYGSNDPQMASDNTIIELQKKVAELEAMVAANEGALKALPEQVEGWVKEEVLTSVDSKIQESRDTLAMATEKWVKEEYTKELDNYFAEHLLTEVSDRINEAKEQTIQMVAEGTQKWIVEEFVPVMENWMKEEYTPVIENWCKNDLAKAFQQWVVEEYTPTVEKYFDEQVKPSIVESATSNAQQLINESGSSKRNQILDVIAMLESTEIKKPTMGREVQKATEPLYLEGMPANIRPIYNLASAEVKEAIARKAQIYNFSSADAVSRFWESIDFSTIVPVNKITEGLDEIKDSRERLIRESIRRHRNRF